jgi:putative ABC transport system substrate-binding protein
MRRRAFLAAAAVIGFAPAIARSQQSRVPVVGYLALTSPGPFAPLLAAFHKGLAEAGFVEGHNVAFEYRWAEGRQDRLPELVMDLVARKVDLISTHGGAFVALAAKEATTTIPIVFETGIDPVAVGLVASMARPGGNVTGVAILTADLNPKRFELLSELVPEAKVIAILVNPKNASAERVISDIRKAADPRGIRIEVVRAAVEAEYETAVAQARASAGALLVANDPVFFSHHERLVALAAKHAIPAAYEWREFVEAGGLMSYGASVAQMHREKGRYVGRVLAGTRPADLPILQPTTFQLVLNLKTAKTLDLTVPRSLLARADEVIE